MPPAATTQRATRHPERGRPRPPTLTVLATIPAGPAEIHIRYTGILNDELRGFYLSKANGRNYAVTQFESTDARRAFPVVRRAGLQGDLLGHADDRSSATRRSRTAACCPTRRARGAGRHTLTFSETPKMSSYLVAMAVGDFQCLEGEADGVPIRICATPDKKELGHIALDAAQRILTFYNRYYSIKYPFEKLDVVAVPDFAAGAMENTAAIFYREVDLLADSKTASVANVQADLGGAGARDGAPVVRRSRHDAVVGRPVAERRIRDLDGKASARRR